MSPLSRRSLLAALPALGFSATARPAHARNAPAPGDRAGAVVAAVARACRPLRSTEPFGDLGDLRPLGAAIGDVPVVGLGEVAHGTHELVTLKHRVFRYLVEQKGFRTFALEAGWGAGLRIDAYVREGTGDPRTIMEEEFGNGKWPWHVREYLDLITWMREHNVRHPKSPVRFMGNDLAYPRIDDMLFERVLGYVGRRHPALRPKFDGLYGALWAHAAETDFSALPPAERRRLAGLARRAVSILEGLRPGPDRAAHDWAVQHARVIEQTATLLAFDLKDPATWPEAMRYRDELMAWNTAWWYRHTGHKVLLAGHNGHTAYETYDPTRYPVSQGAYLRKLLGEGDYLSVGTTFGRGSATVPGDDGKWRTEEFAPPRAGSSEELLERVGHETRYRDFLVDLRAAPPAARDWAHRARPTRDIGPPGDPYRPFALGRGHDVLVHLHAFRAAHPLS
ncbi:erythromycin esterase family protein [Streptomyces syringium]|uniref:erythromycin esterase family protein n=1 Tax=Streptomyces syringium TaxID=76729 RepID=UPI0033A9E49C